jgi:hypothetical protein
VTQTLGQSNSKFALGNKVISALPPTLKTEHEIAFSTSQLQQAHMIDVSHAWLVFSRITRDENGVQSKQKMNVHQHNTNGSRKAHFVSPNERIPSKCLVVTKLTSPDNSRVPAQQCNNQSVKL